MKRAIAIAFICLSTGNFLRAQSLKQTVRTQQVWLAYMNQTRLSDKWGLWVDVHLRAKEDFVSDLSTGILRLGLMYYLNDNTKLTAGYGFINHFPADGHKNISVPEHRPWQQIQWHTKYGKVGTMQYVRLEERFRRKVLNDDRLAEGNQFSYRLRHNFLLSVPLASKPVTRGSLSYIFNNELLVSFGKEIVVNYFDQNRLFTGFAVNTSAASSIQLGYLNVFIQTPAVGRYRSIQGVRVNYLHNIDFR
jgi:hypothetical protein